MITVNKKEAPAASKKGYPWIGESKSMGIIVLFTGANTGVCLDGYSHVGDYEETWTEHLYEPYKGTLELSNG